MCLKQIEPCAQNWSTILGSIVSIIEGPICSLDEKENLYFDNGNDIYMSSEKHEEYGYRNNLNLLVMSY